MLAQDHYCMDRLEWDGHRPKWASDNHPALKSISTISENQGKHTCGKINKVEMLAEKKAITAKANAKKQFKPRAEKNSDTKNVQLHRFQFQTPTRGQHPNGLTHAVHNAPFSAFSRLYCVSNFMNVHK